jgi:hypothetical protein
MEGAANGKVIALSRHLPITASLPGWCERIEPLVGRLVRLSSTSLWNAVSYHCEITPEGEQLRVPDVAVEPWLSSPPTSGS